MKERYGDFIDGWKGLTKKEFNEMYETNTFNWPTWTTCSTGLGLDASETLRANGLHPDKIPDVLKNAYLIGEILKKVESQMELTYVETLDG